MGHSTVGDRPITGWTTVPAVGRAARVAAVLAAVVLVGLLSRTALGQEVEPETPPGANPAEPGAGTPELDTGELDAGPAKPADADAIDEAETVRGDDAGEAPSGAEGGAVDDGAAVPTAPAFDLKSAVDDMFSNVHGSVSLEYRMRSDDDDTDQDIYQWLDLRLGDENVDRVSATVFLRSTWDLDSKRTGRKDYEFTEISDKYESDWNTRLYTAYLTYRPRSGPVEAARIGRQYVYAAETFQIDGAWAESTVLEETLQIRATAYGGVPSHIYESSPSGDWIAGGSVSAEPARGTRASLDYVHVADDFQGKVRNDLTALRVWQRATPWLDLYSRVAYLDSLRDYEIRATGKWPEHDLLVQVSYLSLLESYDEQFTTEFDPYYSILHTLEKYDQVRLRAVKGFGETITVETGADVKDSDNEGVYNRDVSRVYVIPTFDRIPWEDSELSFVLERWSGDGDRMETYGGEITHHFRDDLEATLGTDYSLYGYDAFRDRERNRVRSVYTDVRWKLREDLEVRLRYVHEEDDDRTYDVLTLGFTLAF